MNIFEERLNKLKEINPKKSCTYYWQEQALKAIEYLDNPNKGQVFKWYKTKEEKIEASILYMKERNIKSFLYLAALMTKKYDSTT